MSLKNDIKYPFGDPLDDIFTNKQMIAISNVLSLAKERIWLAEDKPITTNSFNYDTEMDPEEIRVSKLSVEIVEDVVNQINEHYK